MPGKEHKRAVSKAQQKFMAVCGHDPAHARGKCPAPAIAREIAKTGSNKGLPYKKK